MTKEDINVYTRRITQGNRTDIIVVLYDIYLDYINTAISAFDNDDHEELKNAVYHCNEVIRHLEKDLNFAYDISVDLYKLYNFIQRMIAKFSYKKDKSLLEITIPIIRDLREAFAEVAEEDNSGRVMKNAQTVIAGITYGRGSLYEMTNDAGYKRGFYA